MPGTAPADDIPAGPRAQTGPTPTARILDFGRRRPSPAAPAAPAAGTGAADTGAENAEQAARDYWVRAFGDLGLDLTDPDTARIQQATLGMIGVLIRGGTAEWEKDTTVGIPPAVAERLYDLLYTGVQASTPPVAPNDRPEPASV
jgi:hypothetical protein